MDAKKLKEMAGDPRFISGIYNYCDRWCERCPFSSRCLNYAMQEEEGDADPAARDIQNEAFWKHLLAIFRQTKEMILESANEQGIDLDATDTEALEEEERRSKATEDHELAKASMHYAETVDEWFEANQGLFKDKAEQLSSAFRMGLEGSDPEADAASIQDAVEVIRWYQTFIHVKLRRALDQDRPDEALEGFPRDSDGSAKVALIAIGRSIAAWATLREHLAEHSDHILDTLVHLDRLRRRTEHFFPEARAFVRPGFDEPPPPLETE